MTVSAQLYALLAGVTAAGTRVYPVVAPDDVAAPYITFQTISGVPDTVLSGQTGLINSRVQIDCYAATHAQADALRAQVEGLLATGQNIELLTQDLYEPDVKLHRVLLDYSIWHT